MTKIVDKLKNEVMPKIKEEFEIKNDMAAPRIEKVVLNMGLAEALGTKDALQKAREQLAAITGQLPKITKAKKSIATFKLRAGDQIGLMVTLRGKKAWSFMEKLIAIVFPRMRDFRGLSQSKFDNVGNYSLGITEQIIFPEVDYSKIDKIRGLVVTIVVKNSSKEKSKRLFELMGMPFKES